MNGEYMRAPARVIDPRTCQRLGATIEIGVAPRIPFGEREHEERYDDRHRQVVHLPDNRQSLHRRLEEAASVPIGYPCRVWSENLAPS